MEWKVGNALSRDVERQHLNKILADIRTTISGLSSTSGSTSTSTNTINTVTRYAVARFTFTLEGAVTGSAVVDGLNDVTITTTLADTGFVEEAPIDNQYYWRWNGEWRPVPHDLAARPEGLGLLTQIEVDSELTTVVREIEVNPGELTVADGDGVAGNPVLGLADTAVTPGTYGDAAHYPTFDVDEFGRITFADEYAAASGGGAVRGMKITQDNTALSTNAVIPFDNSIPQNTEGVEYTQIATSYTPTDAASILEIEVFIAGLANSAGGNFIGALFKDSDANALAVVNITPATSNVEQQAIIKFSVVASSTSARTYKFRFGANASSTTFYINRRQDSITLGGLFYSHMKITEFAP